MVNAVYATGTPHIAHVPSAMQLAGLLPGVICRPSVSDSTLRRVGKIFNSRLIDNQLARRAVPVGLPGDLLRSLGPLELIGPALARTPYRMTAHQARMVTHALGRRVARTLPDGVRLFHFSEGLGYHALRRRSIPITICERRNMHHSVFEAPIDPLGGFPHSQGAYYARDIFSEEDETASAIVVYSEAARQSYIHAGIDPQKLYIAPIPAPVRPQQTDRIRDRYKLLYVGRGDVFKGLDVAVASVKRLGRPFELLVAGPMSIQVRDWLVKQDNVKYLGVLERRALRDLYSSCVVLLAPSVESFGLAVAEAVAYGCVALCRETTGIAGFLGRDGVRVVEGRTVDLWVESIIRLCEMSDDDLRAIRADAAKSLAEMDELWAARQLCHIYQDLLDRDL